jgi:hypothetical protein
MLCCLYLQGWARTHSYIAATAVCVLLCMLGAVIIFTLHLCATGAFDGDAFMLDGLPALLSGTAHLEYQEICGPSPGQALH